MSDLLDRTAWVIQQKKEWAEILVGFESANRYEILSEKAEPLGFVAEAGKGLGEALKRVSFGPHRPFTAVVFGMDRKPAMHLHRPWYWIWSSMDVEDGEGKPLGAVHRRFLLMGRRYDILDAAGNLVAGVEAGPLRIWRFDLVDAAGARIGEITKEWGGLLKEMFTDADRFAVVLDGPTAPRDEAAKAAILGAAIALDFEYFEDNQNRRR